MRPTQRYSLPRVLYARARRRSRLRPEHRRRKPRPVLPVTIGDEASIERALAFEKGDALFDVRHRFVVSFAAELPRTIDSAGDERHPRRLAAERHHPGADRLSAHSVYDPTLSIRYLTNRPDQTCDPNDNAPHTVDQWFNTSCFTRRPLANTAEPGSTPRNSVRGPGIRAHRPVAVQEHPDCREPPHAAARRDVQPVQPDALRTARRSDRHAELRTDHSVRRWSGRPAGGEIQFLTTRQASRLPVQPGQDG